MTRTHSFINFAPRLPSCLGLFVFILLVSIASISRAGDALGQVRAAEAQRIAVIKQVTPTVVAIYGSVRTGGGSGVLIASNGLALTNYHVVAGAGQRGLAALADGELYPWRLIGVDPGGDLALIQLKTDKPLPFASLGDSEKVRPGDFVMAMGNPFVLAEDQQPTVTLGIVSGTERYQPGEGGRNLLVYGHAIQVDSSINPGNSGGPLFDMAGKLIGINGRGSFEERGRVNVGLGYAISATQIRHFLPDLLATKIAQHATLEATFRDRDGVVICDAIDLDSPMSKAGLTLGDRLVRFADFKVTSANQFNNLITIFPADWPVEVVWERDGENHSAWVRLTAMPYDTPPQKPARVTQPVPLPPQPAPGPEGEGPPSPSPDAPTERPTPMPAPARVAKPATQQGQMRDVQLNAEMARWLLETALRRADATHIAGPVELWLDDAAEVTLLGGDAVGLGNVGGALPAFHLRVKGSDGAAWHLWLSVTDDLGGLNPILLRVAPAEAALTPPLFVNTGLASEVLVGHIARTGTTISSNIFSVAITFAQQRTVKIIGAGLGREHGYASGIIISDDGQILTALGIYIASPTLRVVLPDGSVHQASVVRRSEGLQTVLLKIDAKTPRYFELPSEAMGKPGDWIVAVANPFKVAEGAELMSANLGVISLRAQLDLKKKLQDVLYDDEVLLIDAITSNPGSPGGAVVDRGGKLVGMIGKIIESKATGTRLNYAVPGDLLYRFVRGDAGEVPTTNHGSESKPAELGFRVFALGGRRAPAFIDAVAPNTPAAAAGLRKDDLVLALGDTTVRSVRDFEEAAEKVVAGVPLKLLIKRGNEVINVTFTPEERKPVEVTP